MSWNGSTADVGLCVRKAVEEALHPKKLEPLLWYCGCGVVTSAETEAILAHATLCSHWIARLTVKVLGGEVTDVANG